jgi:hypothetical protein
VEYVPSTKDMTGIANCGDQEWLLSIIRNALVRGSLYRHSRSSSLALISFTITIPLPDLSLPLSVLTESRDRDSLYTVFEGFEVGDTPMNAAPAKRVPDVIADQDTTSRYCLLR